ncbi:MAG: glycosyltransferase family 2 protein [Peptococcaceae bacterium]|nr:glycosyltransferase family 2 protein [Peptococcaceae bacterium]
MTTTVIIVNWNSGALLAECLRHLERQTVRPNWILVVDNASTDNSIAGVEAYANVKVRRMNDNLGFAGGNNRALAECDTEFVALLNPDAFPDPDWLEHLIAAANAHPEVAAFGSRQLSFEDTGILDGIGDVYHISGKAWRNRYGKRQQAEDLVPREIFSPCAAAALYRRQVLVDIGGFDEDFFCYVEDVDLGFRMRLAGHKAMYVPEAVVRHMGSAITGGQHSNFLIYHGYRNLVWTFVKNMPGVLFWLLLPLHIIHNMVVIGKYMARGQGSVILRAKKDAIKGLPQAWSKRKQIQAGRIATVLDIWRILDKRLIPSKYNR